MASDTARSLRAKFQAFDEACLAARSPLSTATPEFLLRRNGKPAPPAPSILGVFDPSAIQTFSTAIRSAWQLIAVLAPSSTGRRQDVIDSIAAGVLRAASEGERDTRRLSAEACWYFIARRNSGDAAPTADRGTTQA